MKETIEKIHKILNREFAKKRKIFIATSTNNQPSVRMVRVYYYEEKLFLLTNEDSDLLQFLKVGDTVNLNTSSSLHNIYGTIDNMEITPSTTLNDLLKSAYKELFFNDEGLITKSTKIISVTLNSGHTFDSKYAYKFHIEDNEVEVYNKRKVTV